VSKGTAFQTGTVSFVHTAPGGATSSELDLDMKLLAVKSENVTMQAACPQRRRSSSTAA
jgi:hypothetical protein